MTRVSLRKCGGYDRPAIKKKITEGLADIGFDPSTFGGRQVAIKPNLLTSSRPEQAVVTHPEVFRAALQLVGEHGGTPVLIESPAVHSLGRVMKRAGYDRVVAEEGCRVADARRKAALHYPQGVRYKSFEVIGDLFEVDFVLNLPKLKTHHLTGITGAVKNLFGLISGLDKSRWHLRARTPEDFAGLLLDLYAALLHGFEKPKTFIHLMDAVVGMEGRGPGLSGRPKKIGAILASTDALAADSVATGLVGFDAGRIDTLTQGARRRLGAVSLEEIEIRGSSLDDLRVSGFASARSSFRSSVVKRASNLPVVRDLCVEKPVVSARRCTLCGQCQTICPAGAITRPGGNGETLVVDYDKCIRCFCCMEVCPEGAIELRGAPLRKLLGWRGQL